MSAGRDVERLVRRATSIARSGRETLLQLRQISYFQKINGLNRKYVMHIRILGARVSRISMLPKNITKG